MFDVRRTPGKVICLAPNRSADAFALGAFLSGRLGHRLALNDGLGADTAAPAVSPLGPEARLAIVESPGLHQDTARRTICAAPCPVIIIPPGAEVAVPAPRRALRRHTRPILCGSDGSARADVAAAFSRRLAKACFSHAIVENIPGSGDTAEALLEVARRRNALMVAVGSDCVDPGDLEPGASITGSLVARADRPVMIVPPWTRAVGSRAVITTRGPDTGRAWRKLLRPA